MKSFISLLALVSSVVAVIPSSKLLKRGLHAPSGYKLRPRQVPAEPTGVKTIISPNGVNITYKNPGEEGVCETTPGVNSYAGFVNLGPDVHSFFWFFEARHDPANAPITLWLNGGPGSDSLIGLFQENGPCNITEDLKTQLNPYSWNEASNMIYLSQPVGVGFSYDQKLVGSIDNSSNPVPYPVDGRYVVINQTKIDTTDLAAAAAWEVIQGFYSALPQLDSTIKSKVFNLATESYGGHYGPSFFNYFYDQNQAIKNGTKCGCPLEMNSLTIINGIIDATIQEPYYPEFAVNNTYGIKSVNDTVYNYQKFALNMPQGCLDQLSQCLATDRTSLVGQAICTEAENMCRDNVEGPYYYFSGRGVYDIRVADNVTDPPEYFVDYLDLPEIQNALGVDTNYTEDYNNQIYYAFQQTGDFVYPNFIEDLEMILNNNIRVSLIYGDADYICNWFGGQAISLAANWTGQQGFTDAGYIPMVVDGVEYGESREYGLFSFTRVYEAGHEVPYYQPVASLQLFNRTINGWDIATGTFQVNNDTQSHGDATATHTEPFVPVPATTDSGSSGTDTATASATSAVGGPIIAGRIRKH